MTENNNSPLFVEDDTLFFADDNEKEEMPKDTWRVLIIDDEKEVHNVTKLVLDDFEFDKRGLHFTSAYSAEEAKDILRDGQEIAVILLDVVMESDDAGLKLIKYIREDLKNCLSRIVLRTGQPGQAPEKKVIVEYDINDYKEKTELTSQKLYTTMVSSLRSYRDLLMIHENKEKLEKIISSSSSLFRLQAVEKYAVETLAFLEDILHKQTLHHQKSSMIAKKQGEDFIVLGATGEYNGSLHKSIYDVMSSDACKYLREALTTEKIVYFDDCFAYYLRNESEGGNLLLLKGIQGLTEFDKYLIEIFCANLSISFDNMYLNKEIQNTQKEIVFTLGEVAEARSRETGNHVRRVAEYSYLLAEKYGLPKEEAEIIRMASPMHDVGKLGIPDSILNKPGKLTEDEFQLMKTHTLIGYDILKNSNRDILKAASIIAEQHHEKFNGKGYPSGLKGNDIHIYGRITAVADVFDALGSDRVYKKAWELDRILELFKQERGQQFDPQLVDLMFDSLPEILMIRDQFKDV
ncbi:MAG: DUF3369 domain-containing protein [Bacillota bacterium]